VAIYYLLPLDRTSVKETIAMLLTGLVLLVVLIALQVRGIMRATYPALQAVGALATSAPLFLLLFAATYFVVDKISGSNFNQPLSRTDALYFTVTVFATVGFGDIVATSEGARALVTMQMVAGIVIIGLGAQIIVSAVKHGRAQRPSPQAESRPANEGPSPKPPDSRPTD
jgi:Ion channel